MNRWLRLALGLVRSITCGLLLSAVFAPSGSHCFASELLPDTVARTKPSIVGIGTFQKTRSPPTVLSGTGFAVADGRHVVTNAHVLPREMSAEKRETLVVLVGSSREPENRNAEIIAVDRSRDLAVLRIDGAPLPALVMGDSESTREGQLLAFTGYPVGMALGLFAATHRATLAARVPIARAGLSAKQLSPRMISRLRESAYVIFQLDATAYPGNSGSPLYDPGSGQVLGIINSVFIQGTREQAISRPSGITYAIPSVHILDVLEQLKLLPATP